ncbi:MAG: type II toxin-antitoxin system Phd/YefM family antitoxin [Bacteroidales bacterium]|nr:type II toxin-antitoxin system Phd/YefM family antitoxin [Bacteroidales bacterium]
MDLVIRDSQEVIINRGNEAAVLIPMDQYNAIKETEYLMSSKEMETTILTGMEDIRKGNFEEVDIDEL